MKIIFSFATNLYKVFREIKSGIKIIGIDDFILKNCYNRFMN